VEAKLRCLTGYEAWIATDNSMAEATFCKGRSSSPELDEMALELIELFIKWGFVLWLFHIAGTRMIAIGSDGESHGELHLEHSLVAEGNPPLFHFHRD